MFTYLLPSRNSWSWEKQTSTHLCITHQTQPVTSHPAGAQVMFLNEDVCPLQKAPAVKDSLKTFAVLDHTCTKAVKKNWRWASPSLPAGWHCSRWILDCIPPWGSNYLYRQKCAFFFFFYNKKTEGSWYVWITGMKTSAQFQAPLDQPWHTLPKWGKGIWQSNQQGNVPGKMTEVASMDKSSKPLHPCRLGKKPPQRVLSLPLCLLPSPFPPLLSLTCTLSETNSQWNDFFPPFNH